MKIIFLGTNGWYDTNTGNTICTLVESKKYYIIFDAGNGIYKLDKYITKPKPIFLFLSHLHIDHIAGFHILPKFRFKQPFTIFVPEKTKKLLNGSINHPFAMSFSDMKMKIKLKEFKEGKIKTPFTAYAKKIKHSDASFGFRIELDGKKVAYCSDTGFCKNSIELSRNADILMHECSTLPGVPDRGWGHSNPEEAAQVAKEANVKKLFLIHFSANNYLTSDSRKKAVGAARKIFINTNEAKDGKIINL